MLKKGGLRKCSLYLVKGLLSCVIPRQGRCRACALAEEEQLKWFEQLGAVLDETSVEVYEADEVAKLGEGCWSREDLG